MKFDNRYELRICVAEIKDGFEVSGSTLVYDSLAAMLQEFPNTIGQNNNCVQGYVVYDTYEDCIAAGTAEFYKDDNAAIYAYMSLIRNGADTDSESAKTVPAATEAAIDQNAADSTGAFILTDPDCAQIRRKMKPHVYELYQITGVPEDSEDGDKDCAIAHAVIDIECYDDEDIRGALDCYGYGNLSEFQSEFEEDEEWEALLAEMFFELAAGCLENLITGPMAYKEAADMIETLSGFSFEQNTTKSACELLAEKISELAKEYNIPATMEQKLELKAYLKPGQTGGIREMLMECLAGTPNIFAYSVAFYLLRELDEMEGPDFSEYVFSLAKKIKALVWESDDEDCTDIRTHLMAKDTRIYQARLQNLIQSNGVGSAVAKKILNELIWFEQNRVRIWMRGGIALNLSYEEANELLTGDYDDSHELLEKVLQERRYVFDGEFYMPEDDFPENGPVIDREEAHSSWDVDLTYLP